MELRQLEYVVAVAEELHFGRAASRLHVTQQSVSEQVRRLERELGAALFTRTSRRVALTAVGETFLPEARRVVTAAEHARQVGRRAARGETPRLRIGYAEDIGPRLIQLAAPALRTRAPSVRIDPEPMTTPDQLVALAEHRLDLAFGWTPPLTPDLDSLLVAREPLVAAMAAGNPLAAEPTLDPLLLSRQPLALVPREVNPWLHDRMVGQLVTRGVVVTIRHQVSSLDRLLPLVLAGSVIGLTVPSAAAGRPLAGVAYRPFSDPSPSVEYGLVWRRAGGSRAVAAFVDVVRELRDAGDLLPPDL